MLLNDKRQKIECKHTEAHFYAVLLTETKKVREPIRLSVQIIYLNLFKLWFVICAAKPIKKAKKSIIFEERKSNNMCCVIIVISQSDENCDKKQSKKQRIKNVIFFCLAKRNCAKMSFFVFGSSDDF